MDYRKKLENEYPLDPITTNIILEPLYDLDYFDINTLVTRCAKDEFSIFIKASQKFTEKHDACYQPKYSICREKVTVDIYEARVPSKKGDYYSLFELKFKNWDKAYTSLKEQYKELLAQFELLK